MKRTEAQAILGGLAADQYGLVTSAQAKAHGVDGVTLLRLRDAGLLEQVGRGVYQLAGTPAPSHLEITVAWLRLDPARPAWQRDGRGTKDGVVSHRSACLVHHLGDIPAPNVELTVPGRLTTREPWVILHRNDGPLPSEEITVVDGLPVTTVQRTIVDLLHEGADGGHVGGVIADAEHRGLLDMALLAEQAEPFTARYGMPHAPGDELLAALAAAAGRQLDRQTVLKALADAASVGASAAYCEALRHVLDRAVPGEREANAKLSAAFSALLTQPQDPGIVAHSMGFVLMHGILADMLKSSRDAALQAIGMSSPAVAEFQQAIAARTAGQLAPLARQLQNAAGVAELRERLVNAALPDETVTALSRAALALADPEMEAALATAAHNDETSAGAE